MEGVRRAREGDLERCRQLADQAIEATRGQRGATLRLAGREAGESGDAGSLVERWMRDAETEVVVGTYSDAVVGMAVGTMTRLGTRSVGRIECCYVEPDARGVGVGRAIVDELVDWFAGQGCTDVDAVALPGDRSSKQLLESAGFKARLLILHRSLD